MKATRRTFLKTTAGAGLAAGLGAFPAMGENGYVTADVAIVGGGLSGLTAARTLVKAGVEKVAVFEARDRVGGRTVNHDIGGGYVAEGGGQWVGPTQTALLALAEELGVGTFPTYLEGKVMASLGGFKLKLGVGDLVADSSEPGIAQIDALAQTVPLNAPWKAERAAEWDAMSVEDWLNATNVDGTSRQAIEFAAALDLSATPAQLSFLYFLYYVHSGGSMHALEAFEGGAQERRIQGGSQILSLKLAEDLGGRVALNAPVQSIRHGDDGVHLTTPLGEVRAKTVILALMPGLCEGIAFEPALPASRVALQNAWVKNAPDVKFNVVYETPFWREAGLNGLAFSDDLTAPVPFTADNSPPDGGRGVLMVLTTGETLPKDKAARRGVVLAGLQQYFGDAALNPIGYHEQDWSEDAYTGGCVSPLAPGVLTRYGASLRAPIGPLIWAGTETAEVWTGYMDGAVRAGQAAAKMAMERLG